MQITRKEIVGDLTNTGNALTLAPSKLNIGGRQWNVPEINQSTIVLDTGTVAVSEFYYTYAVINAGPSVGLVSSLSPIKPDGFEVHRKVGGFFTDSLGDVFLTLIYGDYDRIGTIDKETKFTGFYDRSEGTFSESAKKQTPKEWIVNTTKGGTSNTLKYLEVLSGIFTQTPNCQVTGADIIQFTWFRQDLSSPTSLAFETSTSTGDPVDRSFSFQAVKAPEDYRTTEDKDWTLY